MSRTIDNSLLYFPFDVDFFSNRKIKVLKSQYGCDGVMLYLYLLCEIYRSNGYYVQLDEDFKYIISDDLNMNPDKVGQIMNFLLKRSLFSDTLFKSDKVLTSEGIQYRFIEGIKSRAVKTSRTVNKKFWLLSKEETPDFIQVRQFLKDFEEKTDSSEKKANNSEKKDIKERKENKEKESTERKCVCSAPITEIFCLFNEICKSHPKVEITQNVGRERAVLAIWETYRDMEKIKTVFQKTEKSDFLTGRIPGKSWVAGFDWIMRQENFMKIYEGNYDNRESEKRSDDVGKSYDLAALERFWENVPIVKRNGESGV